MPRVYGIVLLCLSLAGCGPVVQSNTLDKKDFSLQKKEQARPDTTKKNSVGSGVVYFLPRALFRIKVVPDEVALDKQQIAKEDESKQESKKVGKTVINVTSQSTANATANATAKNGEDKSSDGSAGSNIVSFSYDTLGSKHKFTLETYLAPDPTQAYFLAYTPSGFSDDDVELKVKDNLISSVTTSTSDRSADVARASMELIKQAVLLGTGLPVPTEAKSLQDTTKFYYDAELDPSDYIDKDVTSTNTTQKDDSKGKDDIKQETICQKIKSLENNATMPKEAASLCPNDIHCVGQNIAICIDKTTTPLPAKTLDATSNIPGICYRTLLPHRMSIYVWSGNALVKPIQHYILLPNDSPTFFIELKRAALVKNTYDIKFENGMLVSTKATKPSEVLAAVSLPVDIVKAIASIPAEIVQLKINYSSNEKALAEAQQAKFESLQAVNNALLEMYKANAAQSQAIMDQIKSSQ